MSEDSVQCISCIFGSDKSKDQFRSALEHTVATDLELNWGLLSS